MPIPRDREPLFRGFSSIPSLILAVTAVVMPFSALISHRLDGLALASLPLALLAARMERDAAKKMAVQPPGRGMRRF